MKHDTHFIAQLRSKRPKAIPFNLLRDFIKVDYIVHCFQEIHTDTSLHLLWHVQVIGGRASLGRINYIDCINRFDMTPEVWVFLLLPSTSIVKWLTGGKVWRLRSRITFVCFWQWSKSCRHCINNIRTLTVINTSGLRILYCSVINLRLFCVIVLYRNYYMNRLVNIHCNLSIQYSWDVNKFIQIVEWVNLH